MVATEFLSLLDKFKITTYVGVEDFADKLNFLYSVSIMMLSLVIVTMKSYFLKPLACYIATPPEGLNFDKYLENYCWVHGTIAFLNGENLPQTDKDWHAVDETRKISEFLFLTCSQNGKGIDLDYWIH